MTLHKSLSPVSAVITFWVLHFFEKYILQKRLIFKVLTTYQCSDKILGYDELVHEHHNHATFMNQFIVTQNLITALTGDKYFSAKVLLLPLATLQSRQSCCPSIDTALSLTICTLAIVLLSCSQIINSYFFSMDQTK